ncbi:hypothetical protein OS493_010380 [Desmophyllum pertusum]|uniref:Uncharacterized protein n=1 Tax=Desmophyllum pertusum TaxID=174260 RepID=A0A9X0D9W8_9CNID|nr:hypothetical protein OS493_010380 [Desmophyllum pertusum]
MDECQWFKTVFFYHISDTRYKIPGAVCVGLGGSPSDPTIPSPSPLLNSLASRRERRQAWFPGDLVASRLAALPLPHSLTSMAHKVKFTIVVFKFRN